MVPGWRTCHQPDGGSVCQLWPLSLLLCPHSHPPPHLPDVWCREQTLRLADPGLNPSRDIS